MSSTSPGSRPGRDDARGSRSGGPPAGGKPAGGRPGGQKRRDPRRDEEQDMVRLRSKLLSILKRLPQIEREVLEARMGLVDGTPMKPGQVAERMGMTIPEVKRIEGRAMERIREIGPLKGLERFLGSS